MREKGDVYGCHRVLYPTGFMPQAAERLDNHPEIFSNEILIDVIALQPTATAFSRIKTECGGDVEKMKKEFMNIVQHAGKFQCPVTRSGGILIGRIKEIGSDLADHTEAKVGDKIATLVSLSLTPLKIYSIEDISLETEQVLVKAEAILFESGIYAKLPSDLDENISLALMDVAGAPAQVAANVKTGDTVVVIGAGKAGILSLAEAKKRVAPSGKVICMEYDGQQCKTVRKLGIADHVIQANAQSPVEAFGKYNKVMNGKLADFTVNTVNVPDTELTTILTTKNEGLIYFFSMSTNFVKASLGAEGIKKYTRMMIGNGYYPNHTEIAFSIVRNHQKVKNYFAAKYTK
jgi:L-erythro-3,5-diaminohexanoate dehydrogenase